MNRPHLKRLITVVVLLLISLVCASFVSASECFECHDRSEFKGKVVHAPLKAGNCQSCHNPHVSRHEGLLLESQKELCFSCHQSLQKRVDAKSVAHAPVRRGECSSCHDPHAADHQDLLSGSLAQSCRNCHAGLDAKFARKHAPFAQGRCNACHDPHAANDYRLIKRSDPGLCLGCHTQKEQLQKTHMGRSPQSMECLDCHNPHGGDRNALLRTNRHDPFAAGNCRACHGAQKDGMAVCTQCHTDVLETFNHTGNHLLGAGKENPCTSCHTPHASDRTGLMPGSPGSVCRDCHADTFERRQDMLHHHPDWEDCASCHAVHGSDYPTMLKDEPDKVCAECHERHTTFVHPIGRQAIDPRNQRPMTCISCHDPNVGTMFKYNLRGSGERGLCVECHQGY